jgi:biotin transporter BioY
MDRIDLLIIVLLVFAVFRGIRVGFLELVLSTAGFVSGLLLGSVVAAKLVTHLGSDASKLFAILIIEIIFSIGLSYVGSTIGSMINQPKEEKEKGKRRRETLQHVNSYLGGLFEIISTLLIIWLVASGLANVRSDNLGYYVQHSSIVHELDKALPPPPDLIARLESIVSPNGFPNVFVGLEPTHTTVAPGGTVTNPLILNDQASVVKIAGSGCGGIVQGSGFVFANDLVATNAHVVAGIAHPEVIDETGYHQTTVVYFNPNVDLAVLRVSGLNDKVLTLDTTSLGDNTATAVLGYPENGSLVTENSTVIDEVRAQGQNIYNQGLVDRNVYEVAAKVEPGNSGGPLLDTKGNVAGIVFAKSVSQPDLGYALDISYLRAVVNEAKNQTTAVSTGSCAS